MNRGCPPTDRKARTGLLTPPGMSVWASANNRAERVVFIVGAHRITRRQKRSRKRPEESELPQVRPKNVAKLRIRIQRPVVIAGGTCGEWLVSVDDTHF